MLAGISPPKSECKSNAFFITLQMFLKIFLMNLKLYAEIFSNSTDY